MQHKVWYMYACNSYSADVVILKSFPSPAYAKLITCVLLCAGSQRYLYASNSYNALPDTHKQVPGVTAESSKLINSSGRKPSSGVP